MKTLWWGEATQPVRFTSALVFLALTFGLSWGFSIIVWLSLGEDAFLSTGVPPLGMLMPAVAAILVQLFLFRDSPLHFRRYRGRPRWVFYGFLLLVVALTSVTALALATGIRASILSGVANLLVVWWTFLVIYLYQGCGEEEFKRVGLQLGDRDAGFKILAFAFLFLLVQPLLNLVFRLGEFVGVSETIAGIPIPAAVYPVALVVYVVIAAIGTPLAGLAVTFGEEYAWRGFLQGELMKMGRRRGALLVGVIWAIWHLPIISSGVHTYPPSAVGFLMALAFFVLWGMVQSYAVLKTGSVWVAVFLHGLVNSVYSVTVTYLVRPFDKLLSFGLGSYGLALLAVIVFCILLDPVWDSHDPAGETGGGPESRTSAGSQSAL